MNIKRKIQSIYKIKRIYGKKAVVKAVINKISGRPLDYGLDLLFSSKDEAGNYIFEKQQDEVNLEEMKRAIDNMEYKPLISVIMPIYNAPLKWLDVAVKSLQAQAYSNWELCAVNDGSSDREGVNYLIEQQKNDSRIKIIDNKENRGISAASNIALQNADGEYIALMDQDDEITKDAFYWYVDLINKNRDADFIYSDECKIDGEKGTKLSYFICKPDWSPEMMINQMYTGHMTMYRKTVVDKVGGFRSQYDFSQDYDLALRISRITDRIYHLERILYFWRSVPTSSAAGGKDFARESNINALKDHFLQQGLEAEMKMFPYANYGYIKLKNKPFVSIIVPSDSCDNMERTAKGILDKTLYSDFEIILVTNSKAVVEMKKRVVSDKIKYCTFDKKYNFSEKCNDGAKDAKGEIVLFYNDDVIPRNSDWLDRMIELFEIKGVGGVAPMLIYENNRIQYAGMVSGVRGQVGTSFHMKKYDDVDYWFNQNLIRDVSVLSGACVAVRKEVFERIGGFDAINTPSAHSDVDLSYKLIESGYRCVYTPYAKMTHIGNHSWEVKSVKDKSHIYCLKRWEKYIANDPYFTESMKCLFYYNSKYNYYIYSQGKEAFKDKIGCKDILFITHELTRTGAPVQLLNMIKSTYKKLNYYPVVVSAIDGPMREEFEDMGITVIIDEDMLVASDNIDSYARNYDLIVVNTMASVCIDAIKALKNTLPPILWWIHEGNYVYNMLKKHLPKSLESNVHLYCASEYSQRILERHSSEYKSEIIRCGVEDFSDSYDIRYDENGKLIFLTVGTIEWRKGQDILVEAIENLGENYCNKIKFYIIGRPADKKIISRIEECSRKRNCIEYIEIMPREELMEIYSRSLCSIIPSRDEPTSLIGIESMMFSKAIITSDMTGISEKITDGVNGYIFENDNSDQLTEIIKFVVDNVEKVIEAGKKSRKVYENNYTIDMLSERCTEVISKLVD